MFADLLRVALAFVIDRFCHCQPKSHTQVNAQFVKPSFSRSRGYHRFSGTYAFTFPALPSTLFLAAMSAPPEISKPVRRLELGQLSGNSGGRGPKSQRGDTALQGAGAGAGAAGSRSRSDKDE